MNLGLSRLSLLEIVEVLSLINACLTIGLDYHAVSEEPILVELFLYLRLRVVARDLITVAAGVVMHTLVGWP